MSVSEQLETVDEHAASADPVLRVEDVHVRYPTEQGMEVQAVAGISLDVAAGETLGLVGESGCGKSSLARAIVQLPPPSSGSVWFGGEDLTTLPPRQLRDHRSQVQMVFQDPISSLNPRRKVVDIVAEPLRMRGQNEDAISRARATLDSVGLDPDVFGDRKRHQLSGGQCQRVSIARALVLKPTVLVCDEPVSALDVSVQAQILNLLEDLKAEMDLAVLFIAHDLAVVSNISDRVAVMYLGQLVELAPTEVLYRDPLHPYTHLLMRSAPVMDPDVVPERLDNVGEIPSPMSPPSGCRFRTRCPRATQLCADEVPVPVEVAPRHQVACHHPGPAEVS